MSESGPLADLIWDQVRMPRKRNEVQKSMDSDKNSKATLSQRFFRELNEFAILTQ